jgi:hypothetical protein
LARTWQFRVEAAVPSLVRPQWSQQELTWSRSLLRLAAFYELFAHPSNHGGVRAPVSDSFHSVVLCISKPDSSDEIRRLRSRRRIGMRMCQLPALKFRRAVIRLASAHLHCLHYAPRESQMMLEIFGFKLVDLILGCVRKVTQVGPTQRVEC